MKCAWRLTDVTLRRHRPDRGRRSGLVAPCQPIIGAFRTPISICADQRRRETYISIWRDFLHALLRLVIDELGVQTIHERMQVGERDLRAARQ